MAKQKPVYMSGAAANLMLEIWHASGHKPSGVPVKLKADQRALAEELERAGMIERHHVGSGTGAVATPRGGQFVRDAMKHFSTN